MVSKTESITYKTNQSKPSQVWNIYVQSESGEKHEDGGTRPHTH